MARRPFMLFAAWLSIVAAAALAAPADPNSAGCRQALDDLRGREDAALAAGASAASATQPLLALRHRAALACLGSAADGPQPLRRSVQAPIVIAPVGVARLLPRSAAPAAAPGPAVKPIEPPQVVTGCDAGGCRASDGSRLERIGPNLVGPRGICTLQGTLLHCP